MLFLPKIRVFFWSKTKHFVLIPTYTQGWVGSKSFSLTNKRARVSHFCWCWHCFCSRLFFVFFAQLATRVLSSRCLYCCQLQKKEHHRLVGQHMTHLKWRSHYISCWYRKFFALFWRCTTFLKTMPKAPPWWHFFMGQNGLSGGFLPTNQKWCYFHLRTDPCMGRLV